MKKSGHLIASLACIFAASSHSKDTFKYNTKPDVILRLYQMMKDVHEILVSNGIFYWADGGTLLGAVRHKGLIPWDDDLDIDIFKEQIEQFLNLNPIFEKAGYKITPDTPYGIYKISPIDAPSFMGAEHNYPFLDVFIMKWEGDKIKYDSPSKIVWGKRYGRPIFWKVREIFPLKLYPFGEFYILGPQNPTVALECFYGTHWNTVAKVYNHTMPHNKRGIAHCLESECLPAQPIGPLNSLKATVRTLLKRRMS